MFPLTESQGQAVRYLDGDSVVIAAAGSGKTLVLVEKVALLVEGHHVPLEKILIVTFTEKAAAQLKERIRDRLSLTARHIEGADIGTLHAVAAKILRQYGGPLDINPTFRVMEDFLAGLERIRTVRESFLSLIEARHPEALDVTERYGFSRGVQLLLEIVPRASEQKPIPYPELARTIRALYEKRKRERNVLDFNDLEEFFQKILSVPKLRDLCQNRYHWIFVDEFQDINRIQWEILSGLRNPSKNKIVIVGDPRQSIYRFRGAEASVFHTVCRRIQSEGGRVFELNENFRSGAAIIDLVNRVSRRVFSGAYGSGTYGLLVAMRREVAGEVEILPLSVSRPAEAHRRHEAEEVCRRIQKLHDEGCPWGDMTLLFRTRKAVPFYEGALRQNDIPYETSLGEPLLERPEVLAIIFLMRKMIEGGPKNRLLTTALGCSPLAAFSEIIPPDPIDAFLDQIFEKAVPLFSEERHRSNLKAFKKLLQDLLSLGLKDLKALLETLQALREEEARIPCPAAPEDPRRKREAVRLMTVHQSKGLEFPVTVLCDMGARTSNPPRLYLEDEEGGILLREPDREAVGLKQKMIKSESFEALEEKEKEAEIEESKRLLYVALTRAIERLILPFIPDPDEGKKRRTSRPGWEEWIREATND